VLRVDAYADLFRFPWLKYRIDAPVSGSDYLVQVNYKPNKQLEVYSRYRIEKKSINSNPPSNMSAVMVIPRQNWRTQWSYKINPSFTVRSRVELLWYDKKENGFLTYIDMLYKPLLKSYSANFRLQYFETDGYNSRLYAFENDVLYSYSIPVFYNKGFRYYVNLNYDINKNISVWLRLAQSVYPDEATIGTGLDEIPDNKKTELKMQAILTF
jgi:hypothetical protein